MRNNKGRYRVSIFSTARHPKTGNFSFLSHSCYARNTFRMKRSTLRHVLLHAPLAALMVLMVSACSDEEIVPRPGAIDDDDIPGAAVNEAHQYVNQWVRDNMQYWYLWNDEIPENIDRNLNPKVYFQSLLHKDDRFSWIQDDYQELVNALQGISREAGYEFVLYRENPNSDHVVLQIVYTKPESPAETAGLKRGDLVSRINGQQLTTTNYRTLLNEIRQNHTLTV